MKILQLRFKNLNSLYDEWFVDFTDPEYAFNGIFALTGPTGSGKSTILDAVCLALYGSTPRLGKITKRGNEIMSRQTGECYAEVVFESQAGRFCCNWSQHRARKKAHGNLADAHHEISDGVTGKPIETKKSLVPGIVEQKTGMDFERFTRSILLAQGGFDTFLKADVEQKSKILEQITGTGIYSEISRRIHERQRDERERLNLLQAETAGIVILEPDQVQGIQQELETRQQRETELVAESTQTNNAMVWLTHIDGLKREITAIFEEAARLQTDMAAFKPQRDRLSRAVKAATLDGHYATLFAVRKQQADDRTLLDIQKKKLPELDKSSNDRAEVLKACEQRTLKAKQAQKEAAPFIQKVRAMDQMLSSQQKSVTDGEKALKKDGAKIDSDRQLRLNEQKKRNRAVKDLTLTQDYLNAHSQDEWLIGGLAGVEHQLGNLVARHKEIVQTTADKNKAQKALEKATQHQLGCIEQCGSLKHELAEAVTKHRHGKDALNRLLGGRLLREYRFEEKTLLREMAFLTRIAELEDHRAKLEDGKPCPLCGAKEHPFARGNVPVPDETEKKIKALTGLIQKAEDQESAIGRLEQAEVKAGNRLAESEKLETAAANDIKAAQKNVTDLTRSLDRARTEFAGLKQAVSAILEPLGIETIPDSDVSLLLASLRERLSTWQDQVRGKKAMDDQISDIDSELKRLDAVIETQNGALAEKQQNLESLKTAWAKARAERRECYGDKQPDHEERCLDRAVADAEQAEKQARTLYGEIQQALTTTKTQVDSLKVRMGSRDAELKQLKTDFTSALQSAGFSDEHQFLGARLCSEEQDALTARAKALDDGQTDLNARQKDRNTRLATETAKKLTDKSLEALGAESKDLEDALKQQRDTIAGLRHRLAEDTAAKHRIKERQASIDVQKNECRRWEKLHGLIGSADGKKYRNFAQGLTFELMVSHANRQLEKMTDRYLLVRDTEQPLELNVVDNYQAGEIRSTRNLSGGESFIVSLTLALGLSRMASRRVRVDSLFLDEGFGSLDEDALETALETLSGLQQDGKLIGVISHVSAMKERISTQITITPVSGGRSTIAGPGCRKQEKNNGKNG